MKSKTTLLLSTLTFFVLSFHSSVAISGVWSGPKLSEAELTEIEYVHTNAANKKVRDRNYIYEKTWDEFSSSEIMFQYINAADEKTALISKPEATISNAENSGKVDPVFFAAAVDGVTNGIHTVRNDSLLVLSAALDVFSWLNKGYDVDEKTNDLGNYINRPSFFLVKIDKSKFSKNPSNDLDIEENDKNLAKLFGENQDFLLSLPLDCDMSYYKSSDMFGGRDTFAVRIGRMQFRPTYKRGHEHSRAYLCGGDSDTDASPGTAIDNMITMTTLRTSENIWVSRYAFPHLDTHSFLYKKLNIPKDKRKFIAAEIFNTIKDKLNKEWYAIYSAPNSNGEWKVYVVKDGVSMEFDAPVIKK